MVQGLAFLSKKSWHTKNLNNQERVWIAEERKKAESAKTKELQKQIQQELEQQELDAIAGRTPRDRGIDWMYDHGPTSETAKQDTEKKNEEFLLGKEFVAPGVSKGDLDVDKVDDGVNKVVSSAVRSKLAATDDVGKNDSAFYEPTVKERNEAFRLRYEDPMYAVAQQTAGKERRKEWKKQLMERVTGDAAASVSVNSSQEKVAVIFANEKGRKRGDKEKNFHDFHDDRKSNKKRRHRRRSPSYNDYSSDSYTDHKRSRNRRSKNHDRSHKASPRWDDREGGHLHSVQSQSYREETFSRNDHKRSQSPTSYRRSLNHRDQGRRRERSPRRGDGGRGDIEDSSKQSGQVSHRIEPRNEPYSSPLAEHNDSHRRYGLQDAKTNTSSTDGSLSRLPIVLGPDRDLIQRKREEKLEQKQKNEWAARRRPLTEQERSQKLSEMESDAADNEKHRISYQQRSSNHFDDKKDEIDGRESVRHKQAAFVSDMQRRTFGMDVKGISLQERLQQNRNKNQHPSHEGFL